MSEAVEKQPISISQAFMSNLAEIMAYKTPKSPLMKLYLSSTREIKPPKLPKGVAPDDVIHAMDSANQHAYEYSNIDYMGQGFLGFPLLSSLTQRPEYRSMTVTMASEMVRKWVKFKSTSGEDKTEQIKDLEADIKRFGIRSLFRQAAELDGFFGRGQIYIDTGVSEKPDELKLPLLLNKNKIPVNSLKGFQLIEPITTYPVGYNSVDPLNKNYYSPSSWFVQSKEVHSSRLLCFISRPLPNLLKPAYNFAGLSMSQLAIPYVENWIKTRDSVSTIISCFSTSGIKTNMADVLQGGTGNNLMARAQLFNMYKDNDSLLLMDKDNEEFFQFNVPLSSLDKLQAQAQEHMSAVSRIPLVVLLGITPSGLNASSEGEIRVFYDYIADMQEILFRKQLEHVVKLLQLNRYGAIDEDITFEFEPLFQMDEEKLARIRKSDADAAVQYITEGVISADEERKRLASDPQSGYTSLDVSDVVPGLTTELEPDTTDTDTILAKAVGGKV